VLGNQELSGEIASVVQLLPGHESPEGLLIWVALTELGLFAINSVFSVILTFAWILVAPWVFPWYAAIAWVALTQVPRNRMTRWLAIVTVFLAIWHSSGGQATPARL